MTPVSARFVMRNVVRVTSAFSIREQLRNIPELDRFSTLRPKLTLLDAIYRFAPAVRLHPDDIYRPTSVPLYLSNVQMRRHRPWWFDVHILGPGWVDAQSLISQSSGGQHSGQGTERTNFFLEIRQWVDETRRGRLAVAECYVHFRPAPNGGGDWDVQYWFFYAYNGDITTGADFEHEGDWEHVTVRIPADFLSIDRVFYHVHNNESVWRERGEFEQAHGEHVVVYSAYHTHATYWDSGEQDREWLPDDHTADGGPEWRTWDVLRLVGQREHPRPGQQWIKYTGHWGQIGTKISWLSGPYGPAFQRYWDEDT